MKINKLITKVNYTKANSTSRIKYIVIHYVGALGGAEENCRYFYSTDRSASAHYFVGHKGEIWQCVDDKNIAWHCGSKSGYKHAYCRNSNSIGIELCCRKNGNWYFEDATVEAAIELTKELMAKYNIPAKNVIRHYDVTGKLCPQPYVANTTKHTWTEFKNQISKRTVSSEVNTSSNSKTLYRIRRTWQDSASQVGAYTNLENAKKACDKAGKGYYVFDGSGKAIYPTAPAKKSITEIAKEVLQGKWGNGDARKSKITAAGYNYAEVQNAVNSLASGQAVSKKKTVEQIAKEVLQGKWGNGVDRKKRIEAAGYNYNAVQKKVNELSRK